MTARPLKLWFITDIHGSDVCFRKALNAVSHADLDVLIIGADITGKYTVPILEVGNGNWTAEFAGKHHRLNSSGVLDFERNLSNVGAYYWRCDSESFQRFRTDDAFRAAVERQVREERLLAWVELADDRLASRYVIVLMNGGNDDPMYVDPILDNSKKLIRPEGRIVELAGGLRVLSCGLANMTPWHCPRDVSEEQLGKAIEKQAEKIADFSRCIFNVHCPPRDTLLDRAPKLDSKLRIVVSAFGVEEESVGSTAVRSAIEKYQPQVSLHGHIHEAFAVDRIGRTLAFNPGSEYSRGLLRGVYLEFNSGHLGFYQLTREMA
jgi:uncharacterized protein